MKKMNSNRIGVDSGTAHLFSDFAEGGKMWAGEGERESRTLVQFSEPFLMAPAVHIGFELWDISNDTNTRVNLVARDITETGFTVVFTTWGDSKIARMRASWMAIGEVTDDELWDV